MPICQVGEFVKVGLRTPHPVSLHPCALRRCRNIPKDPVNHESLEAEQFAYLMQDRLSPYGVHAAELSRARSIVLRLPEYANIKHIGNRDLLVGYNRFLVRMNECFGVARVANSFMTDELEAIAAK